MPFDVSGWIEIAWGDVIEEDRIEWSATICLDRFMLGGDLVSATLFGLSKSPPSDSLFANRGVPDDCSTLVAQSVQENLRFIKKHGEGNFGHTNALWSEIKPNLTSINPAEIQDSEWKTVFAIIREIESGPFNPEDIRFIVWGNW